MGRGVPASDNSDYIRDHPTSLDILSVKFLEGLRVLVFDEDLEYLLKLEKYLLDFQYKVTRCHEEERAMYLLRNHKKQFDIAIIDVTNVDVNRQNIISEIGSEGDLPIIIISKDDSLESVFKWMCTGACDYLIKPLRPEDLRLIFKHVAKTTQGRRSVSGVGEKAAAATERSSSVGDSTIKNPNKRKRSISFEGQVSEDDHNPCDLDYSTKKTRVVWDDQLHKKFVDAVEYLGNEIAVPKKILERMNVNGITRENVASHLQKYRNNQKKQKDNYKKEEMNVSLINTEEGNMYSQEKVAAFYRGTNDQVSTQHLNNISLHPSYVHQHSTNSNFTTQHITPHICHHDGVSIAVPGDLVMSHQHDHHQKTSSLEYFSYNIFEDEVANFIWSFTQNSEDVSLSHMKDSMMAGASMNTIVSNNNYLSASHEYNPPPMLNEPSISIPSSFTDSSFFDEKDNITMVDVTGRYNYDGYSENNKQANTGNELR